MLVEISNVDKELLLKLCTENNLKIGGIYDSCYDAYVADEFNRCEECYRGIVGDDTIARVRKEAEEELESIDLESIVPIFETRLDDMCVKLDCKPLAVYAVSNNMGIALIDLNGNESIATIRVGNELYDCTLVDDTEDTVIIIGELEIPLSEFVRV